MRHPVPTPQQGQDLGDAIRRAAEGIANTALAGARREIEQKLDELKAQRAGLEEALNSTQSRPARLQIQSRIDRLDRDISELERALARVDRNVTQDVQRPTPRIFSETRPPNFPIRDNIDPTPIVATSLGILFVAFPLTLAIVRFIWKRSTSAPAPALSAEQTRRFDRLEQSVDAIAIEVERISENQRYLTKLLGSPREHSQLP
jgi:hypothetical protein